MKLRHKILTAIFLISVFLILPVFGMGAMWIRHVALLPGTAVVFSDDAAAMDRFMAAALKPYYGDRIGICDGTDDHVEIQAALDAVRDVKLSVGQFNCEVSIDIDNSYQTLRGCGRNTILTTTTANLDIITTTGGVGTEKVGIFIADLCIDGNAGGATNDIGILWTYVDYSKIQNVWSQDNGEYGIRLNNCDFNEITGNICQGNWAGIFLIDLSNNIISGNICQGNTFHGIYLDLSSNNIISGNTCQGNGFAGIELIDSVGNTVVGNTLTENSQDATNTYDDIYLVDSDYNNIQGNTCRAGGLANVPRYGINISTAACDGNLVTNNDIHNDAFGTGSFNDSGTGTRLNVYVVPFSHGSDPQDSGYLIDEDTEFARAWLRLPDKVVQVVRIKVYARSVDTEGDKMRGEFVVYGGADNEAYNTHDGSVADHPSTSANFAANDVIYWTLTEAGVLALLGGDSIEVKVLHEAADNGDCATNAYLRTVEIEYVS